ncbi:hypothetical protein [Streptomyces sp. NPDC050145]|uniref:hypothetical protein n=1 Tax=Streptomyces sp. NPDC050145 TaxID=3365602 RepID=UPI0037A581EB
MEVLDRPEEVDLLSALCAMLGWPARAPLPDEIRLVPAPGWALRIVEARIRALRDGAVEQAVATFDGYAQARAVSVHCRDATLVERLHRPLAEWQLRGKPQTVRHDLLQRVHAVAGTDGHDQDSGTVRLVRVPVSLEEPRPRRQARARWMARKLLSEHAIPNRRADVTRHVLRQPKARSRWQVVVAAKFFLGLVLMVVAALGKWGALGLGGTAGEWLVIAMTVYVAGGTVLALRRTATHRAVPWILPFLVPLSVPVVRWLGEQVQNRYLRAFDVSSDASDGFGVMRAGLWILIVFCGAALLPVAYLGWNRFLNSAVDPRRAWMAWTPAVTLGALLGIALSGIVLYTASRDGRAARGVEAASGDSADYFGLHLEHVCVTFVTGRAPYFGVRPPENRALLTFGPDGDRIDLWGPPLKGYGSGRSASIRLEDAQITYVKGMGSRCPRT